jgi:2'-5' RNA ligase
MPRLFIAVPLPAAVADELASLPRAEQAGVRWTTREQWHITLRFLGSCEVADAVDALGSLHAPAPTVVLGPQVSRLGRNVVCVPVEGLAELAAAVGAATAAIGDPPDPRPFRGHITIARLKHRAACGVTGARISTSFVADRIELVESTLRPDGPVYETRSTVSLPSPA